MQKIKNAAGEEEDPRAMATPSADGPGVPGAGAAWERSRTPPDPRDSADFPWVKVIVWDGDLTEPIHPDAWANRAPDRFRFHRTDNDSSSAIFVLANVPVDKPKRS